MPTSVAVFLILLAAAWMVAKEPAIAWTAVAWWVELVLGAFVLIVYGPLPTAVMALMFAGLWHTCRHPPAWAWARRQCNDPRRGAHLAGEITHAGLMGTQEIVSFLERRHVRRVWRAALRVHNRPRARIVRHGLHPTPAGWRLVVRFPFASTAGSLTRYQPRLASAFRAREVRVASVIDDARLGVVTIVKRDPLAAALADFPAPCGDVWQPVDLGVDEDGHPVHITLPEHNALVAGQPGAGKSTILHQLIAHAASDQTVRLTILDGKMVDLQPWAHRCDNYVGANVQAATWALEGAQRWLEWSFASLRDNGRVKVQPGDALHLVVVDELAFYTAGAGQHSKRFNIVLRDLIARGRAAGLVVILSTQKPSSEVVPTSLRDLVAYRIAVRSTTPEASDTVLGSGMAAAGYDASKIAQGQPGVGLVFAETDRPRRFRAHNATLEHVQAIAAGIPSPAPLPTAEPVVEPGGAEGAPPTEGEGGAPGGASPGPPPPAPAEKNGNGNGHAADANRVVRDAVIAEALRNGEPVKAIARRTGCSPRTVRRVREQLS
jgi:hypothetical protein